MLIQNELGAILDAEDTYIAAIKAELAAFGDSMVGEATEHSLRMGFRLKALIDTRLARYRAGLDPITGEPRKLQRGDREGGVW